jgi:hypothetical protein
VNGEVLSDEVLSSEVMTGEDMSCIQILKNNIFLKKVLMVILNEFSSECMYSDFLGKWNFPHTRSV